MEIGVPSSERKRKDNFYAETKATGVFAAKTKKKWK